MNLGTKSAAGLAALLRASGERVETEYVFAPPRKWRFDLALPDRLVAMEIEGGSAVGGRHVRVAGFRLDIEKYGEAFARGWNVLRVTPQMVKNGRALDLLLRGLEETRPTESPT